LIAVVLIVHLKINSLEALGDARNASLLLVPILARWGIVILLYGTSSVSAAYDRLRPIVLMLNTILVLALTLWIASAVGLWIALSISLSALVVRSVLQWRQSVINCNHLGALVETTEALSLAAFAAL
jgi:hypothetical protein